MFKLAIAGICRYAASQTLKTLPTLVMKSQQRLLSYQLCNGLLRGLCKQQSLQNTFLKNPENVSLVSSIGVSQVQQTRSLTKFSLKKGKRKTCKPVLKRFMRLDWGGWIRTRQGRHKKMWKKTASLKRRLRQHVLVNGTQSWLLDKMVTKFWRRPKYYVDDPYRPYHSRDEFFATRKTPMKY